MRAMAFEDPAARKRLEGILHPMIRSESERLCRVATAPYVLLVVPLLVESGSYRERVRRLCVVDCPEEVQVARVTLRSGLEACQVRAIMAAQASRAVRLAAADDVVDNGGSLEHLREQVAALHRTYLALAAQAGAV
jgi:dephospho-CoA kinase